MVEYDAKQTIRSWSSYLLQLIRLVDPDYKAVHNRPSNGRFQCWAMGVHMKLSPTVEEHLHRWFQNQFDKLILKVTELQRLPVASLEIPMEPIERSHGLHQFFSTR